MLPGQRAPTLHCMRQAVSRLLVVTLFSASAHVSAASNVTTVDIWPASPAALSASDEARRIAGIHRRDEVLLSNADAIVGARLWLSPGSARPAFVYADVGATNSALRWQGLAGIHGGRGIDLVGGWRRVTYHYAPGSGFDSLDFDGPFFGAMMSL